MNKQFMNIRDRYAFFYYIELNRTWNHHFKIMIIGKFYNEQNICQNISKFTVKTQKLRSCFAFYFGPNCFRNYYSIEYFSDALIKDHCQSLGTDIYTNLFTNINLLRKLLRNQLNHLEIFIFKLKFHLKNNNNQYQENIFLLLSFGFICCLKRILYIFRNIQVLTWLARKRSNLPYFILIWVLATPPACPGSEGTSSIQR